MINFGSIATTHYLPALRIYVVDNIREHWVRTDTGNTRNIVLRVADILSE